MVSISDVAGNFEIVARSSSLLTAPAEPMNFGSPRSATWVWMVGRIGASHVERGRCSSSAYHAERGEKFLLGVQGFGYPCESAISIDQMRVKTRKTLL
jgi:hypothetical protein